MQRHYLKTITDADSPYAVQWSDATLLADATAGAVTVTLPPAASEPLGREVTVKKIDASANAVTIDGNGAETIDGAATLATTTQWDANTIQTNQTGWFIV